MAVDRRARDLEQVGDPLDGVIPRIVELLGMAGLVGRQLRASSPCSSAGAGSGETIASICDDELSLKFGKDGEHPEHRAPFHGRGVDALLKNDQPHTPFS